LAKPPKFVGKDAVKLYEAMYQDNDLDGWQEEWKKVGVEAASDPEPTAATVTS
jgi:hypothetical protein